MSALTDELLVRCLDAWTPAALHGHKRVTYADCSTDPSSAAAALRVFAEFADLLQQRTLTMVSLNAPVGETPPGLVVHPLTDIADLEPLLTASPVFGWFDGYPVPAAAATHRGSEVLAVAASVPFPLSCRVDLVDAAGSIEAVAFGTSSEKALEKFKDELWALDEYAGIQLRDPSDPDGALLDISVRPNPGPLRRCLLGEVTRAGGATVAELRSWALRETIFRSTDVAKALQTIVNTGAVGREPISGRLSPTTRILPLTR